MSIRDDEIADDEASNSEVLEVKSQRSLSLMGGGLIGLSLYLHAIKTPPQVGWGPPPSGSQPGWECAIGALLGFPAALLSIIQPNQHRTQYELISDLLLGFSGLINPLLVVYLLSNRLWQFRIALAIAACLLATWGAMELISYEALIGHYLWVAGTLLIVSPEMIKPRHWDIEHNSARASEQEDGTGENRSCHPN